MHTDAKARLEAVAGRVGILQVRRRVRATLWRKKKIWRRVSRRGVLLVLLYSAVAVPGILTSIHAVTRDATRYSAGEPSILRFASNRSAGTLRYWDGRSPRRSNIFNPKTPEEGWELLGPAQGRVRVDPSEQIWLELDDFVFDRPSLLEALSPDDLYRISVAEGSPQVHERLLKKIVRLSGLQELDLRNVSPLPDGWERLTRLPNLQRIWLPDPASVTGTALQNDWVMIPSLYADPEELQGYMFIRNPMPETVPLDK